MIAKYKKEIILFLSSFILVFCIGLLLTYYFDSIYYDIMFDFDIPRIFEDLTLINGNHYRTSVHPLFVIMFQPLVLFFTMILKDAKLVVVLLQSFLTAANIFTKTLGKITKNKNLKILLTFMFIFSWPELIFGSAIETYIYAQFFLIILWLYAFMRLDKKLNLYDYILLGVLGVTSLGVTLTNVVQNFFSYVFIILTASSKNPSSE